MEENEKEESLPAIKLEIHITPEQFQEVLLKSLKTDAGKRAVVEIINDAKKDGEI